MKTMNTNASPLPMEAAKSGAKNSAENAPKWPTPTDEQAQNACVIEVAFQGPNTRKRHCTNRPPRRVRNIDRRSREYLTESEVDKLIKAAESVGRHGFRDGTLILLAYRHGLRVSELCSMRWDQVDMKQGLLHVRRLKNGTPSTHPLHGPELRALRRLKRDYPHSPYLFSGERKGPLTPSAIRKILGRAGLLAQIGFSVHPHMLRHGTGFRLAN